MRPSVNSIRVPHGSVVRTVRRVPTSTKMRRGRHSHQVAQAGMRPRKAASLFQPERARRFRETAGSIARRLSQSEDCYFGKNQREPQKTGSAGHRRSIRSVRPWSSSNIRVSIEGPDEANKVRLPENVQIHRDLITSSLLVLSAPVFGAHSLLNMQRTTTELVNSPRIPAYWLHPEGGKVSPFAPVTRKSCVPQR